VCPEREAAAALVVPACNTEAVQLHLDEIATKATPGAHCPSLAAIGQSVSHSEDWLLLDAIKRPGSYDPQEALRYNRHISECFIPRSRLGPAVLRRSESLTTLSLVSRKTRQNGRRSPPLTTQPSVCSPLR